jgi:hypothetical protein
MPIMTAGTAEPGVSAGFEKRKAMMWELTRFA